MRKDSNQEGKNSWFWFLLLFLSFFFFLNNLKEVKKGGRINSLLEKEKAKVAALQEEQRRLRQQKKYVQSRDFVEKEAREKLGLGYPDQVRLLLPEEKNQPTPTPSLVLPVWQRWWRLFF